MRSWLTILLTASFSFALPGCSGKDSDGDTSTDEAAGPDADDDGFTEGEDCDDNDPYTNPGADDIPYDGIDNDCGGDGDLVDVDGDGYIGVGAGGDDCNDNNPDIYPGDVEICLNLIDDDCDESTSDSDCDGDGYDREPSGGDDCDDEDPNQNPGEEEIWYDGVDQNCDGNDNDQDGDGEAAREAGGPDCDDTDPERNTSAEEICDNGIDENCDNSANQCFPNGEFSVDDAAMVIRGTEDTDRIGGGMLTGDVDGDGDDDIVLGSTTQGTIWIINGPLTGDVDVDSAVRLQGDPAEGVGSILALPGDWDGDGENDLAIGAPFGTPGSDGGEGEVTGVVYLVGAETSGGALPAASIEGLSDGVEFGAAVVGLTDQDGDGLPDLFVGAPLAGKSGDGEAYILTDGAADSSEYYALFSGTFNNSRAGETLASAGDVNADGFEDFFIGAPNANLGEGAALLYHGPVEGIRTMSDFDSNFYPSGASDNLGAALDGAGDLNGDGYDDLVIGAPGEDTNGLDAGAVFVLFGPTDVYISLAKQSDSIFIGDNPGDAAGSSVAGVGDLDGDSTDEILAGAPNAGSGGAGYLIMGVVPGTSFISDAQAYWMSPNADDVVGTTVAGGDIDADGLSDMLIAAPGDDDNAANSGAVYIILGEGI